MASMAESRALESRASPSGSGSGQLQLGEGRGGSLLLDHDGALLVRRQLAQHAGSHALDVLDLVIQQLEGIV